jgi:hypothetical protein
MAGDVCVDQQLPDHTILCAIYQPLRTGPRRLACLRARASVTMRVYVAGVCACISVLHALINLKQELKKGAICMQLELFFA